MSIAINLPTYDTQYIFDRKQFQDMFPDSMICTAFSDPSENSLDLTHSSITPEVMEYLRGIIQEKKLYIPEAPEKFTEASRYLLIPILEIVGHPRYKSFIEKYPNIDLLQKPSLADNYSHILVYALLHDYSCLYQYLFEQIGYEGRNNYYGRYLSAYKNNVRVMKALYKEDYTPIRYSTFRDLIDSKRDPPHVWEYYQNKSLSLTEACLLGRANDTFNLIYSPLGAQAPGLGGQDTQPDNALVMATLMNNPEAISKLRPSYERGFMDAFDYSGTDLKLNGTLLGITKDFTLEHIYEVAWLSTMPSVAIRFINLVPWDTAFKYLTENLYMVSTQMLQRILRSLSSYQVSYFLEWAKNTENTYLIDWIGAHQRSLEGTG